MRNVLFGHRVSLGVGPTACGVRRTRTAVAAAAIALVLLLSGTARSLAPELFGITDLDNDPEDSEAVLYDTGLQVGQYRAPDDDGDGDFDRLIVGVGGGARLVGWRDLDGFSPEVEVIVSDPTHPTGSLNQTDVDGDGDAEILWVGTRGRDLDGDGEIESEENGLVVGSGDLDGDGDPEIIVLDRTRRLGEYLLKGFGINRTRDDPHEVLWVGVLDERERGTAATIEAIFDQDRDGDDDVLLKDLRTATDGSLPFGLQVIDVDGDGDGDLWIRRE